MARSNRLCLFRQFVFAKVCDITIDLISVEPNIAVPLSSFIYVNGVKLTDDLSSKKTFKVCVLNDLFGCQVGFAADTPPVLIGGQLIFPH